MAKVIEAIYANGVLKPVEDLALQEDQRVRLIIEPFDEVPTREARAAAFARLLAGIEKMQFYSDGPLPSRDELHDRNDRT